MSTDLEFDARRAVRAVPVIILLIVLALLPLEAWLRATRPEVTVGNASSDLESTVWAGTIAADGTLAVSLTHTFADDRERMFDVRVPENSVYVELDGRPLAMRGGQYADDVPVRGSVTLTYTRRGAVTRHSDGVVVDLTERDRNGGALLDCPRCFIADVEYGGAPLYVALFAPGADQARLAVGGVGAWRTGHDALAGVGAVRFAAEHQDIGDVAMVVLLPPDAAPDAPLADGSARDHYDAVRSRLAAEGTPTKEPGGELPVGRVIGALIVTALYAALAAWVAWQVVRARRQLAADLAGIEPAPPPDAPFDPPSDLEPALVSQLVGTAGPGRRSAVAGTLLMLAHRGVIEIDGVDSRRYVLRLPAGARGTTRFEEAVLDELRPLGNATAAATLTGPPLWGKGERKVLRRLASVLFQEGRRQHLHRLTLAPAVLIPGTLVVGFAAVAVSAGASTLAWAVLAVGALLAVVAAGLTGVSLTGRGRLERQRWLRYAAWLRANSELEHVGAPGVATWGAILAYAAATGAAPDAAAALSPRT